MLNTRQLQDGISRMKKRNDVYILAHCYQSHDILEAADFVGDSYALSTKAAEVKNKVILVCGVRFMAETVKILSPEKKVILANPLASCAMAEQISADHLHELKRQHPGCTTVAYVNTTAELKTYCDVCVTSSSAAKIAGKIDGENILFLPDRNLGSWVAKQTPHKNIHLASGCCPVHASITSDDITAVRQTHPKALILVHPECLPEVCEAADFVGSTSEIMDYAGKSKANEFFIGTEVSIVSHLQFEHPEKKFYPLSKNCVCHDMRITTLLDVYRCVSGIGGEEIVLEDEVIQKARQSLDAMVSYAEA